MRLIVGLGNPGKKYELTRHNVGFEIVDLLHREICGKNFRRQNFSLVSGGYLEDKRLILAKPQTFMNSSGVAVASLVSRYDISLENLYVIYDDLNLDMGFLRIRSKGSAGGHKGVKSIIKSLGTQLFPRLRVGIGQPPEQMDVMNYVLGRFSVKEREEIDHMEYIAIDALKVMILDGTESAMNKFNARQQDESVE